jgi:hypothetical protein
VTETKVVREIELYDALPALKIMFEFHGLWGDRFSDAPKDPQALDAYVIAQWHVFNGTD